MAQARAGAKHSMFDSDSDDSNEGNAVGSITTSIAQKLVATVAISSNNEHEDLSPTKKMKLIDNVDSSTVERDYLVKGKNNEKELISNDTKDVPVRNPRRSKRTQQNNKTTDKTAVVEKSRGTTKAKTKKSKEVDKTAALHNESNQNKTSISMTKGKSKRGGSKQTPVDSNLVSASMASKVLLSGASNIVDLSNSDSEDSTCNVVVKSPNQPISTYSTKLTGTSNKTSSVSRAAKISNRVSLISSSGTTSSSSAEVSKKCCSPPVTNPANTIKTSECTPIHNAKKPVAPGMNSISGDSIKSSGGESSRGASASINMSDNKVETCEEAPIVLTAAQRARIEQNRQKALLIRQERMNKVLPPLKKSEQLEKEGKKVLRINDTKLVDTGAGFFLEEEDDFDKIPEADLIAALRRAEEPAPLFPEDRPRCTDCGNTFDSSYLVKHFDHPVCDDCRDNESSHALITKTDARNEYLLQDVDLEKRNPPLRYIVRKNPHNDRWGDMKLYLKLQIEKRCLEVWGSEEALEEAIAKKAEQRETSKQKKFKKKMLELRMNVRSSLYTRASKSHEHEYGEEEYHEEDDEYSKTCATCGHSYRFDKM